MLYSQQKDYVLSPKEEIIYRLHWTNFRHSVSSRHYTKKRVDFTLLKQAWSYMLDVHHGLCSAYLQDENGKWYCTRVIDKNALLSEKCMTHLDLSAIKDKDLQSQLLLGIGQLWLKKIMRREPPAMYHVALVELGELQFIYLVFHHGILDGYSLSFVLLPELSRVYMQIASGQQPYLPPVPTSMRDFAKAFREYMSKPELWTRGLEYWTKITPDQFLCIPPDKSGTEIGFFKFAEKSISPTKVKQIKQVATTNKVSPLSIVIFALLQFFGVQQNKWEGFVELVTSGRNAIPTMDLKRTIGFIASTTLEYFSINSKAPLEVNLQGIHHVLNLMRKRDSESLAFMEGPHGNNLKQMCKSNVVVNYMPSLSQLIPELFSPFF